MSYLFQIHGQAVYPNPETLLIHPFNEIWERDKSPKKAYAIQEFAYIEFMSSMMKSNPFREYSEESRESEIRKKIITTLEWQPDDLVIDAINQLKDWQETASITYRYWMSNKAAAEKMIDFFENFDMDERNPKTMSPIYKPRDITSAIADAERMLTTLNTLKKKVDEELFESTKTKGDKTISPFADPNSLR